MPTLPYPSKPLHHVVRVLQEQISLIEKVTLEQVKLRESYQNLLTVPGIGPVLGLTIMLETGDIGRFASDGNYASIAVCRQCALQQRQEKRQR